MKRLLYVCGIILMLGAPVALAVTATSGTLTLTRAGSRGEVERADAYWTTEIHSGVVRASGLGIDGEILRVTFVPDDSTTYTIPAAGHDVRLFDVSGIDILSSAGIGLAASDDRDRITASETSITTGTFLPVVGPLSIAVDDAGTTPTRAGTVRVYFRR